MTNSQPYLAFDDNWFDKHQAILLWLLNGKFRKFFRNLMWITEADFPLDKDIYCIGHNRYYFDQKDGEIKVAFRTHAKYSKRIYYSLKPLWWVMHAWDWLVADRFIPKLSFGFTTLTQFPGTIGAHNPVDGTVARELTLGSGVSWATLIAAAGNASDTTTDILRIEIRSDNASTNWRRLQRFIACFDTSSITSTPTISATVMSMFSTGSQADDNGMSPTYDIYLATPAATNALANADYGNIGSTSQTGAAMTYASWGTSVAYRDFTFNATGIGNVSKTGISQFGLREAAHDVAASTPAGGGSNSSSYIEYHTSNAAGTTNDPKLVVTYSTASTSTHHLLTLGAG